MVRTFELRLIPNASQRAAFEYILRDSQETYNAALQERRDAWRMCRETITYQRQCSELAELRKEPRYAVIASDIQRESLRRVDRAFQAFFRRCKAGQKPGFPRFRARDRYDSFAWHAPRIKDDTVLVPNLGRVRFKSHRAIEGLPKQVTIKRLGQKWIARVTCNLGPAPDKRAVSAAVGIDLGLTTFATLSDGSEVPNPRFVRKHAQRIARAQKNLSRKKRGSNNRKRAKEVARRAYQRMGDARKNFCHHVSKTLVDCYDLIAYEALQIANMARGNLAKSILDAAWGLLLFNIAYKAERAGRYAIAVNPRNTSQMCSGCGALVRKKLSERQHSCVCGTVLGRDHNAAINVLALALGRSAVEVLAEGSKTHYPTSRNPKTARPYRR